MKSQQVIGPRILPPILITTTVVLLIGYFLKQACFAFGAGQSFYCFSDYGPVYFVRELAGGRFPYHSPALEYPAGLGLILWMIAAVASSGIGFAVGNMLLVSVAAYATVLALYSIVERRTFFFAAAPTLALYVFLNWDLLALACAVLALAGFVRRRDIATGLLIGLGAAIKVLPGVLLIPMIAERLREGDRQAALRIALAAALPIIVINAPVAWFAFDGWAYFFRFNSTRPVDWGSLWNVGCQLIGSGVCNDVPLVNMLAAVAFLVLAPLAWWLVTRAAPALPRWQLGFPLIVILILTSKVYSPQYSLWILPWFALVLPDVRLFLAYEAVDIGIYVTTFGWQQRLSGTDGLPLWPLNVFVVLRAIVLLLMLREFVRRSTAASSVQAT